MYSLFLLSAFLATALSAGVNRVHTDQFIINGEDVNPGDYPWQCAIDWEGRHNCGCAIINSQWVVTAAHCLWNNVTVGYRVLVGAHDRYTLVQGQPSFHYVSKYFIHPDFEMSGAKGFPNDIGVIKLMTPIDLVNNKFTKAIKMYDGPETFSGYMCDITGWGYDEKDEMPNVLQYATVHVYDNAWCKENKYPSIFEGHVCVGEDGLKGSCNGDSGGPLTCRYNGEPVLVGLTSFGRIGCDVNYPSVYARVSEYASWVNEIIDEGF